jgi:hypothetical protein
MLQWSKAAVSQRRRSAAPQCFIVECWYLARLQCGSAAMVRCFDVGVACAASVDASVWFFAMLRTSAAVRFEPMN